MPSRPRHPIFHAPAPDEPASFTGAVADVIAGIALMFFAIGAALYLEALV